MTTKIITGARKQRVVIERKQQNNEHPEWWVMFNDGTVQVFDTAEYALKAVQKAASRRNTTVTVTTIEWRDCPDGWKPPEGRVA
jgi:hypothetical protein